MKVFYFIIVLLLFSDLHFANASEVPWTLWKKNSAQSVSYRPAIIDGNIDEELLEIRAKAIVHSSTAGFLSFLRDVNNTPDWLVNASTSKIIKQYSTQKNSFYIKLTQIWPFKPRILILNSTYWQNDDLSVEINLTDVNPALVKDYMTAHVSNLQEYLQVETHSAHWKITPRWLENEGTMITIEYIFIADGRGDTPKWFADHLALKSIWKSMRNIRRELPKEKWQQQKIKGITELPIIPIHKTP